MQSGQLILGEFLLQRMMSQHHTGEVWRALEINVGQLVLLRFIPESLRTYDAAMKRLKRHFAALQQWKHPNIVPVDRLIEQSEYGAFFVSRFVEGLSLDEYAAQWIRAEGRFPFHLIFDVLKPVASALDEAKTQNLVHRSLSHRMIVVSPTEGIQIQGFDLPGVIRESLNVPDDAETLRYLAPEQILNRKAGMLSDQYAFAMIVAELLANKKLFTADNVEELRTKILTIPPPMLPNHHNNINASLQRALHRDPSVRFPSCTNFLDGLSGSIVVDFPPPYAVQDAQSTAIPAELLDSIYALSVPKTPTTEKNTTITTIPTTNQKSDNRVTNRIAIRDMISEKLISFKNITAAAQSANAEKIASKIRKKQRIQFLFYLGLFLLLMSFLLGIYFLGDSIARNNLLSL
jgi:serine/threonine protein kinase